MQHPAEEKFRDFLSDSLDSDQEAIITEHLEECTQCRSRIEQILDETYNVGVSTGDFSLTATKSTSTSDDVLTKFQLGNRFLIKS